MRLNELLNVHKNRKQHDHEDGTFKERSRYTWTTSNLFLMFLENTIKKHTQRPIFGEDPNVPESFEPAIEEFKPKLIKWNSFKEIIW